VTAVALRFDEDNEDNKTEVRPVATKALTSSFLAVCSSAMHLEDLDDLEDLEDLADYTVISQ
jgi:hypothetical protein